MKNIPIFLIIITVLNFKIYLFQMKTTILNIGPQHPAVHGVLRLVIESSGENIRHAHCEFGLLHRGTEKLCEYMEYHKILPFFSRFDYVATLSGEQLYSIALEKLLKLNIPYYSQLIRVLLVETIRISSHLLALTTMAMDTGSITPFLWAFEEREELCHFYEMLSGARMHTALIRPGGVNVVLTYESLNFLTEILMRLNTKLGEISDLFQNPIFTSRLKDIGVLKNSIAKKFSLTGPVRRAGGKGRDLRITKPYDAYQYISIPVTFGHSNDCLGRYQLRVSEIKQSIIIINQLIKLLYPYFNNKLIPQPYSNSFKFSAANKNPHTNSNSMEENIHNFKLYSEGFHISTIKSYVAVESPRGVYGVTLAGNGTDRPHRVKLRSPTFYNLQAFSELTAGELVSNILTILGSLDVVMGEVDK